MPPESLLDEILDDFRVSLRQALERGYSRTHYTMIRLRAHRRLRDGWPQKEVDENLDLIVELLDQIEDEVREQTGQAPDPIDWKAVGQEALAVAEKLGWELDIRFNPGRKTVYLKSDPEAIEKVENGLDRFRDHIHPRLPENVFQRISFEPVELRQPDDPDTNTPQTRKGR